MTRTNETIRRTLLAMVTTTLLLALAACGGADGGGTSEPETTLVDVQPTEPIPATLDSGTEVRADITVRTTEPGGVRVWLTPYTEEVVDLPPYTYAGSSLVDGPELTVERGFRVVLGDEDAEVSGFRVAAMDEDRETVLDERVPNPITYRSLATTDALTLTPPSGTVEQGERVDVQVDFELDDERDVTVAVDPLRTDVDGEWSVSYEGETLTGVTSGTMTGWFTVDDEVEGTAEIERIRIAIIDRASGAIYWRLVDVDFDFVEPAS